MYFKPLLLLSTLLGTIGTTLAAPSGNSAEIITRNEACGSKMVRDTDCEFDLTKRVENCGSKMARDTDCEY